MNKILVLLLSLIFIFPSQVFAIDAFPGCEGFGTSTTTGGRGGTVYIVNTLSDNPADGDTFREAVSASGARYIVFSVSGDIILTSALTISNPYFTIAGQTSPGGVQVLSTSTFGISTHDVIITHMRFRASCEYINYAEDSGNIEYYEEVNRDANVYSAGLTLGSQCTGTPTTTPPTNPRRENETHPYPCVLSTGSDPDDMHALAIVGEDWSNDAYDIVIDHCSFAYGIDEVVGITGGGGDLYFF